MSSKSEAKELNLQIGLPDSGHRKVLYFNRFRVQREDGFRIVHFGLESEAEGVLDSYSCALTDETLADNEKSVLEYIGRVGQPQSKPVAWNKPIPKSGVDVVDIINVSMRGKVGEMVLSMYSQNAAMRYIRTETPTGLLQAEHMALLRSTPEIQKQVIAALYGE